MCLLEDVPTRAVSIVIWLMDSGCDLAVGNQGATLMTAERCLITLNS